MPTPYSLLGWLSAGCLLATPALAQVNDQLTTLGAPSGARFPLTEITWPSNPGDAEVCLWKDDKYAAASITIDDNCKPDHQWWLDICEQYDIRVTWFVVTGGVGGSNSGFNGTWADFQRLIDAGHCVQSHTISHRSTGDVDPESITRPEYRDSQAVMNANLPGNECLTLAYPYGRGDQALAGEYYIAARGTNGQPSKANSINYLDTNKGGISQDYINSVLGRPAPNVAWLNDVRYKRGWLQPLYHFIQDRDAAAADIERLCSERDLIWIDTYVNVVKYAQERDSATLTTTANEANRIALSLTDLMHDGIFDYPLTLKVRLPDHWDSLRATQDGAPIDAELVTHGGHPYALVQAVPNRGAIELRLPTPFDQWAERHHLTAGDNGLADDPNADGRTNLEHFALDTDPRTAGALTRKERAALWINPTDELPYLTFTLPVRNGAVFTGNPLTSGYVDGVRYQLIADHDLQNPKGDLALTEITPLANGLPALSDDNDDASPDWTYRTFRLTQPLPALGRAFIWVDLAAEAP